MTRSLPPHAAATRAARSLSSPLTLLVLLSACGGGGGGGGQPARKPDLPNFSAAVFSTPTQITNPHLLFPAERARVYTLFSEEGDHETVIVQRTSDTKAVLGVDCAVVRDQVWSDGLLIEDTYDWYAQDDAGNVWYMGEDVTDYIYDDDGNLLGVEHGGSWEAGLDIDGVGEVAQPGWAMQADPQVGQFFYQEHYPGAAEDAAEVLAVSVPVTLKSGETIQCLKTAETTRLEKSAKEYKFYAPGLGWLRSSLPGDEEPVERIASFDVGAGSLPDFDAATFSNPSVLTHPLFPEPADTARLLVVEAEDDEGSEFETIVLERVDEVKVVLGLTCAVVRDRAYFDGLLVEDTRDWYAQDDDGNVWYMGEAVTNYEYDDDGNLLGTNDAGSWEAGQDPEGTGTPALPGYQLPAVPTAGASHRQEYYATIAEDMGLVDATDVEVTTPDGTVHTDCVRVVDWNPLAPDGVEYKLYAPGIGLVGEQALHESQAGTLVGAFDTSFGSLPDFGSATFSQSTLIDNPFTPLPSGATWEYAGQTEDGLETTLVEVLASTKVILGVTCLAVRDRVWLGALLIEDTEDWLAQDDDGNVWYMGEAVTNYHYDENGNLLGTDDEGSWEAGQDSALPGHQMPSAPAAAASYRQEYRAGQAEDMALVVRLGETVELSDGTVFTGCLRTLDWNPLAPDALEYKWYAPGIGLVAEQEVAGVERVELTATSL